MQTDRHWLWSCRNTVYFCLADTRKAFFLKALMKTRRATTQMSGQLTCWETERGENWGDSDSKVFNAVFTSSDQLVLIITDCWYFGLSYFHSCFNFCGEVDGVCVLYLKLIQPHCLICVVREKINFVKAKFHVISVCPHLCTATTKRVFLSAALSHWICDEFRPGICSRSATRCDMHSAFFAVHWISRLHL